MQKLRLSSPPHGSSIYRDHAPEKLFECVGKLSNLWVVSVELDCLTRSCVLQLLRQRCPSSLQDLKLPGCSSVDVQGLELALGRLTAIQSLATDCMHLTKSAVANALGAAITHMSDLRSLDLSVCPCNETRSSELVSHLPKCEKPSSLKIKYHSIEALLRSLESNNSLEELQGDELFLHECCAWAPLPVRRPCVQALHILSARASDEGLVSLVDNSGALSSLQTLGLVTDKLGRKGAVQLPARLSQLTGLHALDFRKDIDASDDESESEVPYPHTDDQIALASAIAQATQLQHMRLGNNPFGDEGLKVCVSHDLYLIHLKTLDLGYCYLSEPDMQSLAAPLEQLAHLHKLGVPDVLEVSGAEPMEWF